ncbi:MAG: outer membrane beta-barrel domain-containing protein [Bdellovibrionales bacterium]|nr:outer membrane beta-barrel domain-containing protein [Bdellovibrionales bacterium]
MNSSGIIVSLRFLALALGALLSVGATQARAEDVDAVEVDSIKEKYWTRGDQSEIGVVQNRLYTKSGKAEIGIFGNFLISDPFLNTNSVGLALGWHFNETFGASLYGWKSFVSNSSALDTFEEFSGATANTNLSSGFVGAEGTASLMYGKLSVLGSSIVHYDMHLALGLGVAMTESGSFLAPTLGIGQRFYVSKSASIRFDYRMIYYRETIIEKVVPTKLGEERGSRGNFTNAVSLGVDFMVDF